MENIKNRAINIIKMSLATILSVINIIFSGVLAFCTGLYLIPAESNDVEFLLKIIPLLLFSLVLQYFIFKKFFHLKNEDLLPFIIIIVAVMLFPVYESIQFSAVGFLAFLIFHFVLFMGCAWWLSNNSKRNREKLKNRPESDT